MTYDREKMVAGLAIMKSLIEGGINEADIPRRFKDHLLEVEAYASVPSQPRQPDHLSDEQVANGIAKEAQRVFSKPEARYTSPNGKTYAFASDKQSKRAYAIQKGAGWRDYQVKALCQRYGFQSTKKIPVGVYEQFCTDLQNGPGALNPSSAHLENMAEEVSDAPPF